MIHPPRATGPRRRQVLVGAGLAVAGLGALAAGCSVRPTPEAPDPLAALAARATADAALAKATGAAFPDLANLTALVADNRSQHAAALDTEVRRLHPSTSTPTTGSSVPPPPPPVPAQSQAAVSALATALQAAEKEAATLVPGLSRYRAGLVGAVAASCAALGLVVTA